MATGFAGDSEWHPVDIGAGGYISGIDVAPDGTMVARTDTYGAYIWNGAGWTQLVTANSMPGNNFYTGGVYEIRVAASNSNIIYMEMADGIYKTVDKGASWIKTSFPGVTDPNGGNRADGQKMAVDPTNPNVVFASTETNGLWVTRDGGLNWSKITAVPQGSDTNDPSMSGIVIKGSTVYVGTAGSGVFASNDGGYTWKAIGGPADVSYGAIASDGSYYATDNSVGALWKYAGGAWTKLIADSVHAIALDPFNNAHIVVTGEGGNIQESKDAGVTWTGWNWSNQLESSSDVPWLENSGGYMSSGGLVFDPLVQGKLWQSSGVGVWNTQLPDNISWTTPIVWNSHSIGIEQLVTNEVLVPAGGDPIFASWDRAFITTSSVDSYATGYSGGQFSMGWSIDYASTNSQFIVGISDWWGQENSGYSTDGGKTWVKFAGLPTFALNSIGGSIAASSTTNFIWVPAGGSGPAYTLDGGKTWANVSIAGLTDWSQLDSNYYLDRTVITADRVLPNTFYLYDTGSGVYRTTDGGVSWTKMFSGQVADWSYWNAKIEAVPGRAGELFFTSGPQGSDWTKSPGAISLMHSTDGGAHWQAVSGVQTTTFGFGAPATAGGPATVYMVGYVNNVFGIWYSIDDASSWTQIGERPMGSLDSIKTISGDMDKFGVAYVGFGGSGYAYLDLNATQPASTTPPPPPSATIAGALDDVGSPVTVGSGAIINDATPTLSGTLSSMLASAQSLVIYRDGQPVGKLAPLTTSWSFSDPGASDGVHQYTVRVEDGAGHNGSYSSSFALTIDTVAPSEIVSVTGASTPSSGTVATLSLSAATTSSTTTSSLVTGTVSSSLAANESLIVYRDGAAVGAATVTNGMWNFTDNVATGSYKYTAQVHDSAGNFGLLSNVLTVSVGGQTFWGTNRNDVIVGTPNDDRISGIPAGGKSLGKGTIDVLTGGAGADTFVLGDTRGRYYDDGSNRTAGLSDYARITDFGLGDKLQLKGTAAQYVQHALAINGFSGEGIYHDTNANGIWDSRDELIALVQNHGVVDPGSLIFV